MNIDIPVSPRAEMQNVDVEMFGDFDLDGDRSTATNDFEENSHESKSHFGGISDVEIFLVKKIKIQRETLVGHLVFSKTGAKRKTGVCHLNMPYPTFCEWMSKR